MDFKNFSKFRIFSIKKKILYNNLFAIKRFWSNQKKKKNRYFNCRKINFLIQIIFTPKILLIIH